VFVFFSLPAWYERRTFNSNGRDSRAIIGALIRVWGKRTREKQVRTNPLHTVNFQLSPVHYHLQAAVIEWLPFQTLPLTPVGPVSRLRIVSS
jgi:hypothetical protein